jgi:hypothetical protein
MSHTVTHAGIRLIVMRSDLRFRELHNSVASELSLHRIRDKATAEEMIEKQKRSSYQSTS